jgi:anti-sigma factor RsiW
VSSKAARLHRRQAANKRKYARLRKAGKVPQHTQAERRRAEAEREQKRKAEQYRETWLRRARLPVAAAVAGAAVSVVFGATHATIGHVYRSYPTATQSYPRVSSFDYPDPPHVPESDGTFDTGYGAAGTARTDIRVGPVPPTTWEPWEWTYSPKVYDD